MNNPQLRAELASLGIIWPGAISRKVAPADRHVDPVGELRAFPFGDLYSTSIVTVEADRSIFWTFALDDCPNSPQHLLKGFRVIQHRLRVTSIQINLDAVIAPIAPAIHTELDAEIGRFPVRCAGIRMGCPCDHEDRKDSLKDA
jgi:hypothetical protein